MQKIFYQLVFTCLGLSFPALPHVYSQGKQPTLVRIRSLHPTQLTYGAMEVHLRKDDFIQAQNASEEDFKKFLKENAGKAIVSPEQKIYLVDGHHKARILHEIGSPHMYVNIIQDFSSSPLNEREFVEYMVDHGYCHLRGSNGGPITWSDLPTHVKDLRDDPYRSLAWLAHKFDLYEKSQQEYQDFAWAELFRSALKKTHQEAMSAKDFLFSLLAVTYLLKHDAGFIAKARMLPGYLDLEGYGEGSIHRIIEKYPKLNIFQ